MSEIPSSTPPNTGPEVGRGSMLLLRGGLIVASLVVFGFLAMAVISLLNDDDAPSSGEATTLEPTDVSTDETDGGGESDDAGEPDTGDEAGDEASGDAAAGDLEAELDAFVDEAIAFIETAREQPFLERPEVRLVDVDTMTQIVLDDIEFDLAEDPEEAAVSLAFSRALGFFGPDDDFLDVYNVFVSGGVLGVYFPRTDELLVRSSGELTLMTKATVIHELVHAFDDQYYDLNAGLDREGDASWAYTAVAEGSATYVEDLWKEGLTSQEQADLSAEELAFDPGDILSLDFGFLIYQTSVYDAGNAWLDARIAQDGVGAIEDAFRNPPATSEQIIEPAGAPGLDVIEVAAPEVDGEILWQGTGGQALISAITFLTDPGYDVSQGWGGDAITVYLDPAGNECLRWDIASDSVTDAAELLAGLEDWVASVSGASVIDVGELVRVDRCA